LILILKKNLPCISFSLTSTRFCWYFCSPTIESSYHGSLDASHRSNLRSPRDGESGYLGYVSYIQRAVQCIHFERDSDVLGWVVRRCFFVLIWYTIYLLLRERHFRKAGARSSKDKRSLCSHPGVFSFVHSFVLSLLTRSSPYLFFLTCTFYSIQIQSRQTMKIILFGTSLNDWFLCAQCIRRRFAWGQDTLRVKQCVLHCCFSCFSPSFLKLTVAHPTASPHIHLYLYFRSILFLSLKYQWGYVSHSRQGRIAGR